MASFDTFSNPNYKQYMQSTEDWQIAKENTEIWKDIDGFEEYQISNHGRVYSLKTNKILKASQCSLTRNKIGYLKVTLYANSKFYNRMIHRLVAQTFVPNPENKREVNHINGDKLNNNDWNLEWTTPKENHNHAIDNGFINDSGEFNTRSVLTNKQAREIRSLNGILTQKEIGKLYGIGQTHVSQIINNKLYKNA